MNQDHQPRPEFVANLEWQVRAALRRQDRFSTPVRRNRGGTMRLVSLVLVAALLGAGGVVVTGQVQEGKDQELLLARMEVQRRTAEVQLDAAHPRLREIEGRVQAGDVGEEELMAARANVREAEVRIQTLHLDREEVRLTGKEPENEISVPLVRGRDSVTERLQLEQSIAGERVAIQERKVARLRNLQALGVLRAEEVQEASRPLQEARLALDGVHQRLWLRNRFLEGDVSPEDALLELELIQARSDVELKTQSLEVASRRLHRVQELASHRMVTASEVREAQLELAQREQDLDLAQLMVRDLQSRGGGG